MARKKPVQEKKNSPSLLSKINPSWFFLGLILLVTFFIRLKFLSIPFERDEGAYTYFGQLLLDGKLPYVDFYEMKLPGLYYSYAFLMLIFGQTLKGIHLAFAVLNIITVFFSFKIANLLFKNKLAAISAAIAYAILSLNPQISGFTVQSEHLVAFYSFAGIFTLLRFYETQKKYQLILSGVLISFSFLVKQSGLFFILFGGGYILLANIFSEKLIWKKLIIEVVLYSLGVFGIYLFACFAMYAQGVFPEFWYFTYTYPQRYVSSVSWEQGQQLLSSTWQRISLNYYWFFMLSGIGLLISLFTELAIKNKIALLLLTLLAGLTIAPGLRFYGHYWIQLMPALSILIGGFVYSINNLSTTFIKVKYVGYTGFIIFILIVISNFKAQKNYYLRPNYTSILRSVYGTNPFPETKVIADYIKARTTEKDQIVAMGSEPELYFYTNRRCPSRHAYASYLVNGSEKHVEWQKEFIADVEKNKPKYAVFYNHPVCWLARPEADKTIFTWFNTFSQKNYKLVGIADMIGQFNTKYVWDNDVIGYKPKGQFYIWIFKRNDAAK